METLQTIATTYTVAERAHRIYNGVLEIFDYIKSSDCVTPLELALHQTPEIQPNQKVLVVCAGIGTYVLAALLKGAAPENITAVEINASYHRLGLGIFSRFGVNYVLADYLQWKTSMKFDAVVGNPPFQRGGNKTFYTLFFRKTKELLKEGGYFSLVSPSKAAAPHTKGYKELAHLGWNTVEYGINEWFPNINQPIAIYSGRDKTLENEALEVAYGTSSVGVQRGLVLPVQYINSDKAFRGADIDLTMSIFRKVFSTKAPKVKERFETLEKAPDCPYVYLAAVAWRFHPMKEKGGPYGLHTKVNDHDKYLNGEFMRFETQKEAENMSWILSKSLVYRFIAGASCRAKFLPKVLREEIPDLSQCSTDEELFKLLKLTEEEVSYLNLWNEQTNTPGRSKK
jgi:hypothetical protein